MSADTPAAVLRRAADKLRQLATAATPGPWQATPRYRKGTQTVVQYDVVKPPRPGSNTPQRMVRRPEDAADVLYGVAMHPGVGLALADWLTAAATVHVPDTECGYCIPARNPLRLPCPALTVARQLLGEEAPAATTDVDSQQVSR